MDNSIRTSLIAGTWYPSDPGELRELITSYFHQVKIPAIEGKLVGLISPHAGYPFSGQTAAYGYRLIQDHQFDVVVVISPLHHTASGRYVVNKAASYWTPLGCVPIHQKLLKRLSNRIPITRVRDDGEHSLEIQLPFLQVALGDFALLPVMIGHGDINGCDDLTDALTEILGDLRALLVASSDLHHIADYNAVHAHDQRVIEALSTFDTKQIRSVLNRPDSTVCGKVPIAVVTDLARRIGANQVEILHHTTSGDVTGERESGHYTVGYLSAAIVRSIRN